MSGLTPLGFERKRLDEVKTDLEAALQSAFGTDIDLRSESVFGQIVGVLSLPIAELWEELENVYQSQDPDFAESVQLDAVMALNGIERQEATSSTVYVAVQADVGVTLPATTQLRDTLARTWTVSGGLPVEIGNTSIYDWVFTVTVGGLANGVTLSFTINGVDLYSYTNGPSETAATILAGLRDEVLADTGALISATVVGEELRLAVLDIDTVVSLSFTESYLTRSNQHTRVLFAADETGPLAISAGQMTDVITVGSGINSVTNYVAGTEGRDREEDIAARLRRRQSVAKQATATVDAIFADLADLTGVTDAIVYQNNTDSTDVNGVPRQHIWAVVLGGADDDIANAIYQNVAGGIGTFGTESVIVTSLSGQSFEIKFDRPEEVYAYITMTLSKDGDYPLDGDDLIKEALVAYGQNMLGIGDDLVFSRLYTPINSVPGHEVDSLFLDDEPVPAAMDTLTAAVDQRIRILAENITILEA